MASDGAGRWRPGLRSVDDPDQQRHLDGDAGAALSERDTEPHDGADPGGRLGTPQSGHDEHRDLFPGEQLAVRRGHVHADVDVHPVVAVATEPTRMTMKTKCLTTAFALLTAVPV